MSRSDDETAGSDADGEDSDVDAGGPHADGRARPSADDRGTDPVGEWTIAGMPIARAWAGTALALVIAVVVGSLAFTREVYGGFIWHYFWGPVYADANSAACAVWDGGARRLLYESTGPDSCATAPEPVAYPGYTIVSEVGYMLILLLALVGVVLLLRRLDVGTDRDMFYGLLPFVFLGGALRVVEDAADEVPQGVEPIVSYPWNTLLISPIIYFTMFALALAAVVACVALERRGAVRTYARPLFAVGAVALALNLGYLLFLSVTEEFVGFFPQVTLITLFAASVGTLVTWVLAERFAPSINEATGLVGAVVIWGHAVDGAANVLILDWSAALGLGVSYVPKHPVNQAVVDLTTAVLPASITSITGTVWPFLVLKLAAATGAVWLFNDEMFDESPRYAILFLIAVLAVGLGPGTRDMLRATFGI